MVCPSAVCATCWPCTLICCPWGTKSKTLSSHINNNLIKCIYWFNWSEVKTWFCPAVMAAWGCWMMICWGWPCWPWSWRVWPPCSWIWPGCTSWICAWTQYTFYCSDLHKQTVRKTLVFWHLKFDTCTAKSIPRYINTYVGGICQQQHVQELIIKQMDSHNALLIVKYYFTHPSHLPILHHIEHYILVQDNVVQFEYRS